MAQRQFAGRTGVNASGNGASDPPNVLTLIGSTGAGARSSGGAPKAIALPPRRLEPDKNTLRFVGRYGHIQL